MRLRVYQRPGAMPTTVDQISGCCLSAATLLPAESTPVRHDAAACPQQHTVVERSTAVWAPDACLQPSLVPPVSSDTFQVARP